MRSVLQARRRFAAVLLAALVGLSAACSQTSGSTTPPRDVTDGRVLYEQNCAACHGEQGRGSIAPALADPLYLRLVSDHDLETVIGAGRVQYEMPAYAQENGGSLSDRQIQALVAAIRGFVPPSSATPEPNPPPLQPGQGVTGNAQRGAQLFAANCSRCHGDMGKGGTGVSGGAINVPNLIALTSDQELRRIVITGLPSRGQPDYAHLGGAPLTDQDVTDIVAFMASWRQSAAATPTPPSRQH